MYTNIAETEEIALSDLEQNLNTPATETAAQAPNSTSEEATTPVEKTLPIESSVESRAAEPFQAPAPEPTQEVETSSEAVSAEAPAQEPELSSVSENSTLAETTNETVTETPPQPESKLADFLEDVTSKLDDFEQFVSRRFDEISMEVNATSQQMDMAEEGMAKKFGDILEVLTAVSYAGDGNSQANTGVELEAVVELTDNAANRIMDAADKISNTLQDEDRWEDPDDRGNLIIEVEAAVSEIYMACEFQDLTSQRIRTALENIRGIEDRLSTTLDTMGIKIPEKTGNPETDVKTAEEMVFENTGRSQEEIDKLFD